VNSWANIRHQSFSGKRKPMNVSSTKESHLMLICINWIISTPIYRQVLLFAKRRTMRLKLWAPWIRGSFDWFLTILPPSPKIRRNNFSTCPVVRRWWCRDAHHLLHIIFSAACKWKHSENKSDVIEKGK
jgi:hypothetical protein